MLLLFNEALQEASEVKQNGKDQKKKYVNVVRFDELVVISNYFHERRAHYGSNRVVDS